MFKIWAILNLTPDSFFAGSRTGPEEFIRRALSYLEMGADVLDVGAESTRPYSDPVSAEEEWGRLEKPLLALKQALGPLRFRTAVSIDTYKGEIAEKALEMGAGTINDVGAGGDPRLLKAVAQHGAKLVLMHSAGPPKTMQDDPKYQDVTREAVAFLNRRTASAVEAGVEPQNIIWDPGIGFGKTLDHNLTLIKNIGALKQGKYPLMYGVSRKSFLGKLLDIDDVEGRKDPTIVVHTYLALREVDILRVHDIAETVMIRKIIAAIDGSSAQET